MKTIFALEALPKSIFLAGPTPRKPETPSWRPEALRILEELGFEGNIYVPESENWLPHNNYDGQVHWEWEALNMSTVVVFWVPRDLSDMPAFTTNVEFGYLVSSGKLVLGYPKGASKMSYLDKLATKHGVSVFSTLHDTLREAIVITRRPFGQTN